MKTLICRSAIDCRAWRERSGGADALKGTRCRATGRRFRNRLLITGVPLHRLPIDALKIDRSFVAEMGSRKEAREIIRAILGLANGLEGGVVVEGVETVAQALAEIGCNMAQGYYARPLPPEAAKALTLPHSE